MVIMPRSRISNWHYVYVLQSTKTQKIYIGYTENLQKRILEHNAKKNFSTKSGTPWECVYAEACINKTDAIRREDYLKTTQGGRFLKIRLREFLHD